MGADGGPLSKLSLLHRSDLSLEICMKLNINGQEHDLDRIDPEMPLLWVLREKLNLTGTKYGCGRAQCGACTVLVNGEAVRSCSLSARHAVGKSIVTIEAVSGRVADAVRSAWQALNVAQCGYCQSGQIMTTISLLSRIRKPTDAHIDAAMDGNICRCGTYMRIRKAIREAARSLA
jgi:isoquinoline 1-oxidoreductase alpha subunit